MIRKNRVEFRPARGVPFYFELQGYEWVSDFNKLMEAEKQERALEREKKRIAALLPSKELFTQRLKADLQKLQQRRADALKQFLLNNWKRNDPLANFQTRQKINEWTAIPFVPEWKELEAALNGITLENTTGEAEKVKLLAKVERELAGLRKQLVKLRRQEYFTGPNQTGEFMPKVFVDSWRNLQSQVDGPVGPTGLALERSPKNEQKAWRDLSFDKFVFPGSPYMPHNGIGVIPSDIRLNFENSFTARQGKRPKTSLRM